MSFTTSLTNHFLIAMPGLQDPNFSRTVAYICEHTEQGAMGIVINRPMDIRLGEMLDQLDIVSRDRQVLEAAVYLGGPVQPERGFVLHSAAEGFDSTLSITAEIGVTTSRDVLEAIADGKGPSHRLIALGYAGWGKGQLEQEMSANAWLSSPADEEIIFRLPAGARWQAAAHLLGIDMNLMSGEAGHAWMGALLGFDFGPRKIGVAVGQTITCSASALTTLRSRRNRPDWGGIERLVREWQPQGAVVGLPFNMDDTESAVAPAARRFARQLGGRFGLEVHLVDERLTSLEARRRLGRGATSPEAIDAVAAKLILETWLTDRAV